MTQLPEHVWQKIMLYNSHPVADIFKAEVRVIDDVVMMMNPRQKMG